MARRLVLDQLGLQLRGAARPNVQPVRAVAAAPRRSRRGDGGRERQQAQPQDYFDPARWSDPAITRIAEAVFPVAMEIPEGDPNLSASLDGIATQETAQAIIDIVSALDRAPSVRDLTRLLEQVA
jgi:hypothetical protein